MPLAGWILSVQLFPWFKCRDADLVSERVHASDGCLGRLLGLDQWRVVAIRELGIARGGSTGPEVRCSVQLLPGFQRSDFEG